jgi:ketopantoate reductase
MCPVCIASTAVMVAGAGSTGGILAVCISKFRNFWMRPRLLSKPKSQANPFLKT